MKNIEFKNASAKKIYDSYIRRIRRTISVLSKSDKEDVLMEFNSHIFEGLQSSQDSTNEVEKILKITQDLGDPEEVLKPLIAERKLQQATRTFNPKYVFQAILLNIKNGFVYTIFAILYIFLFGFGVAIYLKIMYPKDTGLFFQDGRFMILGTSDATENLTEVLGNWFIPVMLFSVLVLYFVLTFLLKIKRKK